jgi:hypothetical protein
MDHWPFYQSLFNDLAILVQLSKCQWPEILVISVIVHRFLCFDIHNGEAVGYSEVLSIAIKVQFLWDYLFAASWHILANSFVVDGRVTWPGIFVV